MLCVKCVMLHNLAREFSLECETLIPVCLRFPLQCLRLLLVLVNQLSHRDDLLGEGVESAFVGRAILRLSLHHVRMVYHQILDLSLQTLVLLLQCNIVLGLTCDLIVTPFHLVLRLFVLASQSQVLLSYS